MEPWLDDLVDDLQSISFNSTTTTATDINRSTSSGSEATWTATASSISSSSLHHHITKPRAATPSGDPYWDAITRGISTSTSSAISLTDLRFLHRLGSGDIGSVFLAEIKAAPVTEISKSTAVSAYFAAKVMDKKELASRNKEGRARTEREILEMLDHPFLPTLYASIDSPKWSCLLTEFCPGGDLHVLRQRQPAKRFPESAVRYTILYSHSTFELYTSTSINTNFVIRVIKLATKFITNLLFLILMLIVTKLNIFTNQFKKILLSLSILCHTFFFNRVFAYEIFKFFKISTIID